jgi:hypothetical protein
MVATIQSETSLRDLFADMARISHGLTFPYSRACNVGGIAVSIRSASPELQQHFAAALPPTSERHDEPAAQIYCWAGDERRVTPQSLPLSISHLAARGELPGGDTEQFRIAYNSGSRLLMVWDRQLSQGYVWTPNASRLPRWEYAAPLRSMLHWLHQENGRQLAHAAVVATRGRGVLLAGAGGSGKSSTALSCALAGMEFIGDDYVCVRPGDEGSGGETGLRVRPPRAYSIFQTAKLDPRFIQPRYPGLFNSSGYCEEMGKMILRLDQFAAVTTTNVAEICAIVLPSVGRKRSATIHSATSAEAFLALAPTTAFQLPYGNEQTIASLGKLSRQLPCFRLSLSTEPQENVAAIQSIMRGCS